MEIKKEDYSQLTKFLLKVINNASKEVMKIYEKEFSFINKQDNSPLTEADISSNKIIVESIKKKFENAVIISEENINKDLNSKDFFLIDPLDGTKEFIKKNGEFTINIAYLKNYEPVIGLISIPAKGLIYYTDGINSYKTFGDGKVKKIYNNVLSRHTKIAVSRSHLDERTENLIKKLKHKDIIKSGSSLKFCLIAEGKADIYFRFGNTMEWDIAAGHAILKNANCLLTDETFKLIKYGKKDFKNNSFFAFGILSMEKIKNLKNLEQSH